MWCFVLCLKQVSPILTLSSVDCGAPKAPQNGYLESYTSTTEGSEVFYSCDRGHLREGRMRAVCTDNGWTPNPTNLSCTLGMLHWFSFVRVSVLDLVQCLYSQVSTWLYSSGPTTSIASDSLIVHIYTHNIRYLFNLWLVEIQSRWAM